MSVEDDDDHRRRRTWLQRLTRPWTLVGLLCLCLLLASPFVFRAWKLSQVINLKQPFDRAAFIARSKAIPPGQNAADDFKLPIKPLSSPNFDLDQFYKDLERPDFQIPTDVDTWLSDNKLAMKAWSAGAWKSDYCDFDLEIADLYTSLPKVQETREFNRLMTVRARLEQRDGKLADAFKTLRTAHRAAMLQSRNAAMIQYRISIACLASTIERGLLAWAVDDLVSEAELASARQDLKLDQQTLFAPASQAIKTETITFENTVGTSDSDKLLTDFLGVRSGGVPLGLISAGLYVVAEPTYTHRVYKQIIANHFTQCDQPFHVRVPLKSSKLGLYDLSPASMTPGMMSCEAIEKASTRALGALTMDFHANFQTAVDRMSARFAVLDAVFALEMHRRRHGVYPQELADMDSDLVDDVPLDPFTGQDLLYRLDDDATCVIYSVGANLYDDGGIFDDARDVGYALGVPHTNR